MVHTMKYESKICPTCRDPLPPAEENGLVFWFCPKDGYLIGWRREELQKKEKTVSNEDLKRDEYSGRSFTF